MNCTNLKQFLLHSNADALFVSASRAGFGGGVDSTVILACPAHHLNLLHPLYCSPEESSARVAAVSSKVVVVWRWSGTHITAQGQRCGRSSLFNLLIISLKITIQDLINVTFPWRNPWKVY